MSKIIEYKDLSPYQKLVVNELIIEYPKLNIQIGRGDRLMVNDNIIKGILVYDSERQFRLHDMNMEQFIKEIQIQIIDKIKR